MKKILHIIGGMNRAGAETMIMNIYRNIDRSKYQFDFVVYKNERQDYQDEIESLGGRVIYLPFGHNPSKLFSYFVKLRKIIKTGNYCAIHVATSHNSAFALLSSIGLNNVKRIVHSHSTNIVIKPNVKDKLYQFITKKIIGLLTDTFLACGKEAGEYLFGEKKFRKEGIIINNAIDIKSFFYADEDSIKILKKKYDLQDRLVLGTVARLTEIKNHKKMIEIAEALYIKGIQFKMLIIGQGELESELKKTVETKNLEKDVLFLGIRKDIPELMHIMDVFLMPSFFEGNPVTLIEAQAAVLPALISENITDKIDLGLGLVHKAKLEQSADAWINELMKIERPKHSYQLVEKQLINYGYSLDDNIRLLCDIYRS